MRGGLEAPASQERTEMTTRNVAVIVGSIRTGSLNRMMAHALAGLAPASLALEMVEIGRLPLYNQDLEADAPAEWTAFRQRIKAADAVLFVTPEHNRSVPGSHDNIAGDGSRIDVRASAPISL